MNPQEKLFRRLCQVFPDFEADFDEPAGSFSFHRLMLDFLAFWGKVSQSATDAQVAALASIINESVDEGGDLENAMDTCFLEHLSQVRGLKPLKSHLSPAARAFAR